METRRESGQSDLSLLTDQPVETARAQDAELPDMGGLMTGGPGTYSRTLVPSWTSSLGIRGAKGPDRTKCGSSLPRQLPHNGSHIRRLLASALSGVFEVVKLTQLVIVDLAGVDA